MNACFRVAFESLKKQRRSSILLLGTVILSAAFLVCMCIVGSSSIYTAKETRMDIYGEYKAILWNSDENTEDFLSLYSVWNEKGKTELYGYFESIDGKTLALGSADEASLKLLRVRLSEGRKPSATGEAVVEKSTARLLGLERISVGDEITVTVTVGSGEEREIRLSVCGICENFSAVKNNELSEAATVTVVPSILVTDVGLPVMDTVWFLNSENEDFYALSPMTPDTVDRKFNSEAYPNGYNSVGVRNYDEEASMAVSTMAMVGSLILVCTATVTMNGFIMSVDRRSRQMSLMRCIGATKRQAFGVIAAEGVILLGFGLVPGLGLGAAVSGFAVSLFSAISKTELIWSFAPWSLPLAAGLCTFCVLAATLLPALRASRRPPIFAAGMKVPRKMRKRKSAGRPLGVLGMTAVSAKNSFGRDIMTGLVFSLVIIVSGVAALIVEMNLDKGYSTPDVGIYPESNSISYEGEESKMLNAPFFVNYEALTRYLTLPTELPQKINSELDFACTWSYIEPRFGVSVDKSDFDDYLNGYFLYEGERLSLPESETIDGLVHGMQTGTYPYLDAQKGYGIGEDEYLLNTYVFACSDELLTRLSPKLTSGKIDLDAIKRGDEVILALPNYEIDYSKYPFGMSTAILGSGEDSPNIEGQVFKNENWTAGDKLTITWVDIGTDGVATLCRKEATVGATVTEGLSDYGMPGQIFGIYVATDTLNGISAPHTIRNMKLYFPVDREIEEGEEEVTTWLSENYPSVQTETRTEVNQAEQQLQRMTIGIAATVISCLVSLGFLGLVNTASVRVHAKSHQIGLMRCIGATKTQVLLMLSAEGGAIGIGAAVLGCGVCRVLFPLLTREWEYASLGTVLAVVSAATVLISVCTVFVPAAKLLRSNPVEATRKSE